MKKMWETWPVYSFKWGKLLGDSMGIIKGILAGPPPPKLPPTRNKGLIAGHQWLISPDHKALFLGGGSFGGG